MFLSGHFRSMKEMERSYVFEDGCLHKDSCCTLGEKRHMTALGGNTSETINMTAREGNLGKTIKMTALGGNLNRR
jgi:hypothetical protein